MFSLSESVYQTALCDPSRSALVVSDRTVAYSELVEAVEEILELIHEVGASGRRIALQLGNNWRHVAVLLAADAANMTTVPMDIKWSEAQVLDRMCLTSTQVLLRDGPEGLLVEQVDIEGCHNSILAPSEPLIVNGNLIHTLAPTGGTSGTAKAVALSTRAVTSRFLTQAIEFGFSRDTTFLCAAPLFHGGGRSFILSQLYFGGTVVLHESFYAERYAASLRSCDITFAVPTMLQRLEGGITAPRLKCLIVSGAKVDDSTSNIALSISTSAVDYYASVDTGPIAIRRLASEGSAQLAFQATVLNMRYDASRECPPVVDYVDVQGPCVADAEIRHGQLVVFATDAAGHPIARMSDRIQFNEGGTLRPLGRSDDLIVTGGVNVDPTAVEEALRSELGKNVQVAVIGVPDSEWGERVVAFVAGAANEDPPQVLAAVRSHLSGPETPKDVLFVSAIPLTSVGKLDKQALRHAYKEQQHGER